MSGINLRIDSPKHFTAPQNIKPVNGKYSDEQKAKIAKASKEFESLLTSMMLKSMNKTTNGMFGEDSFGGDFFDTIFEGQLASFMSDNKSIGIADILYKKLTGESLESNLSKLKGSIPRGENELKLKNIDSLPSIKPTIKSLNRLEKFDDYITEAAERFGIDKNLIKSVILTESAGNEKAVSSAKAKGLMQLIDSTASEMGVKNIWNPRENIMGGTKYLSQMLRQYGGDLKLALASYNAGPGAVDKYNGVPPFDETKNYITRVIGYFNHLNG